MLRYWVGLSVVCGLITTVMLCLNIDKDRIIENQNRHIEQQNELIERQKKQIADYDYLSEKLKAVDEYIVWKNILIPKNTNYDYIVDDWNAERLEVINNANWIKELKDEY